MSKKYHFRNKMKNLFNRFSKADFEKKKKKKIIAAFIRILVEVLTFINNYKSSKNKGLDR